MKKHHIAFAGLAVAGLGTVGTWYGNFQDSGREQRIAQASQVTGATIIGNGGSGADITATGIAGQPAPVGWDIQASGAPGQSVTGLRVIQNGPGTGMRITVGGTGPATGVRVGVVAPPQQ